MCNVMSLECIPLIIGARNVPVGKGEGQEFGPRQTLSYQKMR